MSAQDILGQDEIDALMNGAVVKDTAPAGPQDPTAAREYNFGGSARIVRGRMHTLELINDRMARLLRTTVYGMLRRTAEVSAGSVQFVKFQHYVQHLKLPTSLNLVQFHPLRGTGLIVLEPNLVFSLVDTFFGGTGRHANIEGREFSETENSIVKMLLQGCFANITEAWSHVVAIRPELIGSEVNPNFANIVSPTEILVVCPFTVEIDDRSGELHVVLPYSMIQPLREELESGMQRDRPEHDDRWSQSLRAELEDAQIEVRVTLGSVTLKLGDVLRLRPGDILPSDFTGSALLLAEDVPMFRGVYGHSGGQHAVKVSESLVRRPQPEAPPCIADLPL